MYIHKQITQLYTDTQNWEQYDTYSIHQYTHIRMCIAHNSQHFPLVTMATIVRWLSHIWLEHNHSANTSPYLLNPFSTLQRQVVDRRRWRISVWRCQGRHATKHDFPYKRLQQMFRLLKGCRWCASFWFHSASTQLADNSTQTNKHTSINRLRFYGDNTRHSCTTLACLGSESFRSGASERECQIASFFPLAKQPSTYDETETAGFHGATPSV